MIPRIRPFTQKNKLVKNIDDNAWKQAKIVAKQELVDLGSYITYLIWKDKAERQNNEGQTIN